MNILSGKSIILGISGGIAAYKSVLLLRELQRRGADVTVVMTQHARQFIAPLTFETLSKNPVYTEMFDPSISRDITHISLAEKGDILIAAPATANVIGKFAHGIADDLLSALFLSFTSPIIIAPSMNTNMYFNSAVQENITVLKSRGIHIAEPEEGALACGKTGAGRMAEIDQIVKKTESISLIRSGDLQDKRVLITAGPTKEPIDPVRYISNSSSGRMGYALAESALERGGEVILISGPTCLPVPERVSFISVNTCNDMKDAVMEKLDTVDIVIMCAAVCDFAPETAASQKIKKDAAEGLTIKFKKNPDILSEIRKRKKDQVIVGFAAETENLIVNALKKLKEKHLDLIIANHAGNIFTGFDSDINKVTIIDRDLSSDDIPVLPKKDVANKIIDKIARLF